MVKKKLISISVFLLLFDCKLSLAWAKDIPQREQVFVEIKTQEMEPLNSDQIILIKRDFIRDLTHYRDDFTRMYNAGFKHALLQKEIRNCDALIQRINRLPDDILTHNNHRIIAKVVNAAGARRIPISEEYQNFLNAKHRYQKFLTIISTAGPAIACFLYMNNSMNPVPSLLLAGFSCIGFRFAVRTICARRYMKTSTITSSPNEFAYKPLKLLTVPVL